MSQMLAVTYDYTEALEWAESMSMLAKTWWPMAMEASVLEAALFFEREAKMGAPFDTGRLRSSIGHGPEGVWKPGHSGDGYWIDVGTNVEYAPYMEFGFTMSKGHVAYIKAAGGFRYVHPFTFEGLHFFQKAASATDRMISDVVQRNIQIAIAKGGW